MPKTVARPKTKCCVSKSRCSSCPIRLLKEGRLPDGYAVAHRKLVRTTAAGTGKITKAELAKAVKSTVKNRKRLAAAVA